jgi:hypothetical protein
MKSPDHRLIHYCVDMGELVETERVVPVVAFPAWIAPRR